MTKFLEALWPFPVLLFVGMQEKKLTISTLLKII